MFVCTGNAHVGQPPRLSGRARLDSVRNRSIRLCHPERSEHPALPDACESKDPCTTRPLHERLKAFSPSRNPGSLVILRSRASLRGTKDLTLHESVGAGDRR